MVSFTDQIKEEINKIARETARNQSFGISIANIEAIVKPSKKDPSLVTIRTVISFDAS